MAATFKNIIPRKACEITQTTQYTANNCRTQITKFTVTNTGLTNQTFSVNLVANGDTASADNLVLSQRQIGAGETYLCPELVGQGIEPGGFISTLGSSTDLTISAAGLEITS